MKITDLEPIIIIALILGITVFVSSLILQKK